MRGRKIEIKRIAFIRPNMFPQRSSDAMTPLVFAILAARTPADIETVLWDERLADIPFDEPVDLVAITAETYTARRAYQIASQFRDRNIPVVIGGYHPTFEWEESLRFADAVVIGDGELVWADILADAAEGTLRKIYQASGFQSLAREPSDRSIFAGKKYAPVDLVQFGRGCKFNCEFCSIRAFYGNSQRQKPIEEVVAEIAQLKQRHFFFVDDNLFNNAEELKKLLRALVPLGKTWSCQASIDITRDPELVELMAKSGCAAVLIGFESLEVENLKQMKKLWSVKTGSYSEQLKILRDAGIMIYGTFVFGYDHDTPDSFKRVVEFSVENKFLLANFNPLTAMPGTGLYERLKKQGRLINERWWLEADYRYGDATFRPKGMTAEQLTEGCLEARKAFNTYGSIGHRLLAPRTNLRSLSRAGFYLLANLTSRREIYAKQGRPLGDPDHPLILEAAE